jgi:hypothetical protein
MFAKFLISKPFLAIGILMFTMVWVASGGKNPFFERDALKPTSCRAALVKLEKRLPEGWKLFCEGNNLAVEIFEKDNKLQGKELTALMYRQLANYLVEIGRASESDILEKVFIVRLKLMHDKIEINAVTEGKYIVKLSTLTSPDFIREHLQQTVQVKETLK